jgi:hypothetical protein
VHQTAESEVNSEVLRTEEWSRRCEDLQQLRSMPDRPIECDELYDELERAGMGYGETFRNMIEVSAVEDLPKSYGKIRIPVTKSLMPENLEYGHIIHPATLDAIFHLLSTLASSRTRLTS